MNRRLTLILVALSLCLSLAASLSQARKPFGGWGRSMGESRADSLTGFDVQKYEITLSINHQTHQINGNVLATVMAEEHLTTLPYNLIGLSVSSVLVNGSPANYTHTGGIINISLNIPAGQSFTTQVFYSGVPQLSGAPYNIGMIFSANTVFTISDPDAARYWWPCYDHPWDKAIVDLHITLRSDWKVAANGIRTSIVDNGDGTNTTHWIGQHPMTTYLACITAGPYVEINQSAGDLPIQSFVMQNQYNNALVDFAHLPDMIGYFNQIFGPYPFEKYGQAAVSMSTYGAMEHQTMTTLGNYIITGTGAYELVIAHELAHQWYGNAVSFLTFADVWLSEGFATYSEHLWTDKMLGWASAVAYVASSYHQYYLSWENPSNPHTIYDPSFNNYFAPPSYEKAASVLHMLRLKIGDTAFFQLLQDWFSTYCHGNVVTAEFEALAESISGQDLTQFFQQWIYGSGIPSLQYSVWNNPASDLPLKIIARTTSNTATQFHIEVPFRLTDGADSDSLLVFAQPNGVCSSFGTALTGSAVLSPNHNNWTLLRGITEQLPVLAECLPSNNVVLLSWEQFLGEPALQYQVYRRLAGGAPEWQLLTPEPLDGLSYTDLTVQNGVTYEYAVAAIDAGGWSSRMSNLMSATPVAFSFANDLLVVDETRDGNGANINPNDSMVDVFYDAALTPIVYTQWDCASQGLPGLDQLGQYRVVFWHADDFSQNLLQDDLNTLGGYLLGGGRVIVSGWKTPAVLTPAFLQRFGGNLNLFYDNTACLLGAQSTEYPALEVDPLKLIGTWNGMLPYIYTFGGAPQTLYTAVMGGSGQGNGNCAVYRWHDPDVGADFILSGFPLYFMQAAGVRGFLQAIISELLSDVSLSDALLPAPQPQLSVSPNPFRGEATLRLTLPGKGATRLGVYNLKGQLVRRLLDDDNYNGGNELLFDGRDDRGAPLASGVYLLRLEYEGRSLIRKFSLVK